MIYLILADSVSIMVRDLTKLSDSERNYLIKAFNALKNYCLLSVSAYLLLGFGLMWFYMRFLMRRFMGTPLQSYGLFSIIVFFIITIGCILLLSAVYLYLMDSMKNLSEFDAGYSIYSSIVRIGYIVGATIIIIGLLLILMLPIIGSLSIFIGLILLFIGKIGLIASLFKIGDEFGNSLFLVSAIIYLIGIFIPPLDFLASIFLYISSRDILNRIPRVSQSTLSVV